MDVNDFLGSTGNWYKAAEHSQDEKVTINGVESGTDYNGNKCLNLSISGDRKIQLKKKNVEQLAALLGNDIPSWEGQEVGLELGETVYEDKKFPAFKFVAADDLPF